MNKTSFHILRVGIAITFLWIGILIFKTPEAWGGYLQPWAVKLLPISIDQAMFGTAILDIIIGFLILTDTLVWLFTLVATLHILTVLTVSGITDITVRDVAILAGLIALTVDSLPNYILTKIKFLKKQNHLDKPMPKLKN